MDIHILLAYLGLLFISNILMFSFIKCKIIFKGKIKCYIILLILLFEITYFISFWIKYCFSNEIIKEKKGEKYWFIEFNKIILCLSVLHTFIPYIDCCLKQSDCCDENEKKYVYLNQLKGIKISNFELPSDFDDLSELAKNELIFNNSIGKYEYKLNKNQINIITKINNIRKQYNVPLLKYDETENLPDFIINEKTKFIFYDEKNIFKLNSNLYIFKYPINEFINSINKEEILSIITNNFLDRISIIE